MGFDFRPGGFYGLLQCRGGLGRLRLTPLCIGLVDNGVLLSPLEIKSASCVGELLRFLEAFRTCSVPHR